MSVDIKRKSSPANINGSHTTYIILKNAMKMEEIEKISHLEIYIGVWMWLLEKNLRFDGIRQQLTRAGICIFFSPLR